MEVQETAGQDYYREVSVEVNQAGMGRDRYGLGPVRHSEFLHDVVHVVVDCPFTYPQDNRYVPRGFPLLQPVEDFPFPNGEDNAFVIRRPVVEEMKKGKMQVWCYHIQYGMGAFVMFHRWT